ncbi:MAG: glycosyltransferase family 39 protein [Kiritimatiellae bacterium]|nr:glycosyltransferase family 39 protein [Kiritimatiellia bacterium]
MSQAADNARLAANRARAARPGVNLPRALRAGLPAGILVLGFVLRLVYAHGLPLNIDEKTHLALAREISFRPGHTYLPLGDRRTNHPIGTVYVTALADRLGGGRVGVIRLAFVVLSLAGLVGLHRLARGLFGFWVGVIALGLAAFDHHLIAYAPMLLEPAYLCLVPWALLVFHRLMRGGDKRLWIVLGACFGIGFQCSEIFLLLGLPLALVGLLSGRLRAALKAREFYAGALLFVLIVSPTLAWNWRNQGANAMRHLDRVRALGLTPRALLLYIGGLLIAFTDSSRFVMGLAHTTYVPWCIPCHWLTGLFYLGCLIASLRFVRDPRHRLLQVSAWAVLLAVSVLNANEAWNEFGWASMTVFPIIVLAAWCVRRLIRFRWGLTVCAASFLAVPVFTLRFLGGLKMGYDSPNWEKRYVGKVLYYFYAGEKSKTRVRRLTDAMFARHPDSVIVNYYKGVFAQTDDAREAAFRRALAREPFNPLVNKELAVALLAKGRAQEARDLLAQVIWAGHDFVDLRNLLAQAEYMLGNYVAAASQARWALRMKPDDIPLYKILFDALVAMDRRREALDVLARRAMLQRDPAQLYLDTAEEYAAAGRRALARILREKARGFEPGPRQEDESGQDGAADL